MSDVQDDRHVSALKTLGQLRYQRDQAKAKFDELDEELKRSVARIYEDMAEAGVGGMKVDVPIVGPDGRLLETRKINFIPSTQEHATIQDRGAFVEWCHANSREDLISEKENKGDVNSYVRECLDDGRPLPDGLGFYTRNSIGQRAG